MRPLHSQLLAYIAKIAQTHEDAQLKQLLKELSEDTLRTEEEENSGSKGLKFYEDLLQTIKPHKIPLIEEFEMEDIRGPESKPPTVRPGKIVQKLQDYEAEDYEPEGLEGEILMAYGPTPPLKILLRLLTEHGNQAHAFGRGIFVSSSDGKKIIPATLRAVMEYLGY